MRIGCININTIGYADDTVLIAKTEDKLLRLLDSLKRMIQIVQIKIRYQQIRSDRSNREK